MTTKTIVVEEKADDPKEGMTVEEIQRFLYAAQDTPGRLGPIECVVTLRRRIKELSVEVVTDD